MNNNNDMYKNNLLRRQIALTGEASTKILEDVQTFSYAAADATGGNAKLIAQQTSQRLSFKESYIVNWHSLLVNQ